MESVRRRLPTVQLVPATSEDAMVRKLLAARQLLAKQRPGANTETERLDACINNYGIVMRRGGVNTVIYDLQESFLTIFVGVVLSTLLDQHMKLRAFRVQTLGALMKLNQDFNGPDQDLIPSNSLQHL